jgi:hypothetical protein
MTCVGLIYKKDNWYSGIYEGMAGKMNFLEEE